MKLCLFAGTFNPIHNAHLKMAQYVLDNFGFEKILFIPAFKPPHKDYDKNLSIDRLNMVKLATSNNPNFEVSEIEFERDKLSYTYDTVTELYKKYNPSTKISFIIGTDAFEKIDSWYKTEELKNLLDFIVFVRQNEKVNFENKIDYNYKIAKMDFIDISSTEIRNKVLYNQSIKNLVPKEVEVYIKENGLYRN